MKISFKTISKQINSTLREKKSEFIAHSFNVTSEADALRLISDCKKKYWDATHNAYAYFICGESDQPAQKYSDDGEPSGTAGIPILEAIRRLGLEDVLIVVTRYFGGIQLGASGLVRAYGKVASMCLDQSEIILKVFCYQAKITIGYTLLEKVQNFLEKIALKQFSIDYAENVQIIINVPIDNMDCFVLSITDFTNGQATVEINEKIFLA